MFNKKEKQFKKLTEQEIQQRLYGIAQKIPKKEPEQVKIAPQEVQEKKVSFEKSPPAELKSKSIRLPWKKVTAFALIVLVAVFGLNYFFKKQPTRKQPTSEVKQATKTPAPASLTNKPYTIQAAVYKNEVDAIRIASKLKKENLAAYVAKATSKKGKIRYRIYVGGFSSVNEATTLLSKLKTRMGFPDSFLRKK